MKPAFEPSNTVCKMYNKRGFFGFDSGYHAQLSNENQCYDEYPSTGFDVVTHFITDLRLRVHRTK